MLSGTQHPVDHGGSVQPARLAAFTALLISAVLVTGAGVMLGGLIQDRLEAGPSATQTEALERIDREAVTSVPKGDPRGPNRADLGGGRADLGAAR